MKVFITGVAGFLGSHLARSFVGDGVAVVGCDSLIGGDRANVPPEVDFHGGDCADVGLMRHLSEGCDVVFHCAATAYEGLSVFSPSLVVQNIVGGAVAVFSAAASNRVRRVVFCSSMARYGANPIPFHEDMTPAPVDPYGIAKVAAEDLLRTIAETHGVEWVIAVPHNIIGPGQKYDDPYRNVAAIMINRMLRGQQPIIYGDGTQRRCFSFIDDCLFCLRRLADLPEVAGEIINIGPDEELVTINRLAAEIADLLAFDLHPHYVPRRPLEVRDANCSADKARRLLNYRTPVDLRAGLAAMITDIRQRGPKPFTYHHDLEIITKATPLVWRDRIM